MYKIFIYNKNEIGFGFFKVEKRNQTFYYLIFGKHVLRSIYINEKKEINVSFDVQNKNTNINIILDDSERFIRE